MSDEDFLDPIEIRHRDRLKSLHEIIAIIFPIVEVLSIGYIIWSVFAMFYFMNITYNIAQMLYNGIIAVCTLVLLMTLVSIETHIKLRIILETKK